MPTTSDFYTTMVSSGRCVMLVHAAVCRNAAAACDPLLSEARCSVRHIAAWVAEDGSRCVSC